MVPNLTGKVCLVTGAARGIGRGIALQLGSAGATVPQTPPLHCSVVCTAQVYIIGRTRTNLDDCAAAIKERGGRAVTVQMDHGQDAEVEALFQQIANEQAGQLDLLVNNAYAGVSTIFSNTGKKFWDTETPSTWDAINGVSNL